MNIRLTLRAAGDVILTKEIVTRSVVRLSGNVGEAARELYHEAQETGYYPVGTTLTEEFEPDAAAVDKAKAFR